MLRVRAQHGRANRRRRDWRPTSGPPRPVTRLLTAAGRASAAPLLSGGAMLAGAYVSLLATAGGRDVFGSVNDGSPGASASIAKCGELLSEPQPVLAVYLPHPLTYSSKTVSNIG